VTAWAADQRQRGSFSTTVHTEVEKFTHRPPCGRVALLADLEHPGEGVAARLWCKRKMCPDCGPRRRRQLAEHYTAAIGTTPVVRWTVARSAWKTTAGRLQRAKADYVRIPGPAGMFVVYATSGPGQPVANPRRLLARDFDLMPSDRAHATSSRAWAMTSAKPAAGGKASGGKAEATPRWELLGHARVTLPQVIAAAKDLGLYRG
jgi:hypothetical protein